MVEQGFKVDPAALTSYSRATPRLAEDLGKVGSATLGPITALPADAFGKIGAEVGIGQAFQQAAKATVDGLAAASAGLSGLATSVAGALTAYQRQDADHAAMMRRTQAQG
ncbi:type VII secretion target [Allokutzneria albata]|uniref:type VII secretion target n=1 Tax=Allokutzneria albata TaxID=211114 RepID=UPI00069447AF|nr:type VII secretion target [Allokutzneria albata]